LVLEAFDTLLNKRGYEAAERFRSPNHDQHSAHIKPGRDGRFDLIWSAPATLRHEAGHRRRRKRLRDRPRPIHPDWKTEELEVADCLLAEDWSVLRDEATDQACNVKIHLANSEPSTHGT